MLGKGRFVGDLKFPNLHEVAFVRSPVAHGRILEVVKPEGREARVFTARDLDGAGDFDGVRPIIADCSVPGFKSSEYPVLADGKVRFVGEAIAMCLAPTRARAEDLAQDVVVEIAELSPLVDMHQARAPGAPLVHDHWGDNLFLETLVEGDIEAVAKTAPIVVRREMRMNRQCMVPLEGKGVLAYWDHRADQLVVHTSTQVPHLIRTGLSLCLGIDQRSIRVVAPDVGGGFGYKCVLQPEEVCIAWLAKRTGLTVRWTEDRREHLVAGANTRSHHYDITAYADERGKLLAIDAQITIDIGAYSVWPFTACLEAGQAAGNLPGPYAFDAYRCRTYSVATNKPPFTPYRGVARPGVCFAIEQIIDAIAREAGREAWEVRLENLVPGEAMPFTNVANKHYDSGDYPESLRRVVAQIDLPAIRARQAVARQAVDGSGERLVGVGFASYTEQTAHGTSVFAAWGLPVVPGYEQATARLTADGGLEIRAGIHSFGQGLETTLAQVASSVLTISVERIQVVLGDTASTPYSTGAYASRGMVMAGGAVSRACDVLAARIRKIAAHLMQCSAGDVSLSDGRAIGPGASSVAIDDVGKAWYLRPDQLPRDVDTAGLEVTEGYKPDVDTGVFTYASHGAVVEVDSETGKVDIVDYVIVEDCGTVVNPMIVEGQTIGGAVQGIGTALFEEVAYDESGQPLASTFMDYRIPGATEAPVFRISRMESPSPHTAHGIKGVGEGGPIAPTAAIINAINDALRPLGAEVRETPVTPRRLLRAIFSARAGDTAKPGPAS